MPSIRKAVSKKIDNDIVNILSSSERPFSTRDIAIKIKRAWHSVNNHCLRLQLAGKVDGFKVGNMNLWTIKKEYLKK